MGIFFSKSFFYSTTIAQNPLSSDKTTQNTMPNTIPDTSLNTLPNSSLIILPETPPNSPSENLNEDTTVVLTTKIVILDKLICTDVNKNVIDQDNCVKKSEVEIEIKNTENLCLDIENIISVIDQDTEIVNQDTEIINQNAEIIKQDTSTVSQIVEIIEQVTEKVSNLVETQKLDNVISDIKIMEAVINVIEEVAEKTEELSA